MCRALISAAQRNSPVQYCCADMSNKSTHDGEGGISRDLAIDYARLAKQRLGSKGFGYIVGTTCNAELGSKAS